jgi:hypothetical protein
MYSSAQPLQTWTPGAKNVSSSHLRQRAAVSVISIPQMRRVFVVPIAGGSGGVGFVKQLIEFVVVAILCDDLQVAEKVEVA